jgi:hypothetical protein
MKIIVATVFLLFPLHLAAQFTVDISWEKTYIQSATLARKQVYQLNPDMSLEVIKVPLPENANLSALSPVKIRLGYFWVSSHKNIFRLPIDDPVEQSWEAIKMPEGIQYFSDFEIISDTEAILCGCKWDWPELLPVRNDVHIIINYCTGALTKSIEHFDYKDIDLYPRESHMTSQHFWRLFEFNSYMFRIESKVIIVGRYSGKITVIDTDDGKIRKHKVLSDSEMPKLSDLIDIHLRNNKNIELGQPAFWPGDPICWVGPLEGDELIICHTILGIPDDKPAKPFTISSFKTLNLSTGKLTNEGTEYRGHAAGEMDTLFEKNGQLLSAYSLIKEQWVPWIPPNAPDSVPAPENASPDPTQEATPTENGG